MPTTVYAGLWALIAASSLLLGAVLAERFKVSGKLVGPTMGFGAGALISALAYELIPDAHVNDVWIWLAFAVGALLYYGLDTLIERRLATAGLSIVLGALLDGIPESIVLGLGIAVGGSVSIGFLVAVFVSNVPESLAATVDLRNSHTAGWIHRLWLAIVAVSGLSGAVGVLAAELRGVPGRARGVPVGACRRACRRACPGGARPSGPRGWAGPTAGSVPRLGLSHDVHHDPAMCDAWRPRPGCSGHCRCRGPDGGRCAVATRRRIGGASPTVWRPAVTVVDPPTRHPDGMTADRPPSGHRR